VSDYRGRWVKCVGCGKPLGLFDQAVKRGVHRIEAGGAAHAKPACALYGRLSAEQLHAAHAQAEAIEPPDALWVGTN
jgi:hypothetical protein